MNPYSNLAPYHFWRKAVALTEKHRLNPVVNPKFIISRDDRVATAGSCFAQHIARALSAAGFSYLVTERGEAISPDEAHRRNFGVFTARYGNIYTTRQLLQVLNEAVTLGDSSESYWSRDDGKFVDPYRPLIEPDGFDSPDAVRESRCQMLRAVVDMANTADIFVFTLGLTEGWRSKSDGSVYPLAPGVGGGTFDPYIHEFVNFTVEEVMADLNDSLELLKRTNPKIKVILTVSPVPLIATYENRHVLVSTTYSKSVLRVAAEAASQGRDWVDYFPSYEIITGAFTGGSYFADNLRDVLPEGVAHVMRVFLQSYTDSGAGEHRASAENQTNVSTAAPIAGDRHGGIDAIICDESAIDNPAL